MMCMNSWDHHAIVLMESNKSDLLPSLLDSTKRPGVLSLGGPQKESVKLIPVGVISKRLSLKYANLLKIYIYIFFFLHCTKLLTLDDPSVQNMVS